MPAFLSSFISAGSYPAFSLGCLLLAAIPTSISFYKSLLISQFTLGFHVSFAVRTPLHYLRPVIHPEVISILPKHPSQAINWYYQIRFHIVSFLYRDHFATIAYVPVRCLYKATDLISEIRCKDSSKVRNLFPQR